MEVPFCNGLISLLEKESAVRVGRSCMNKRVDAPQVISSQDVAQARFSWCFVGSGALGPLPPCAGRPRHAGGEKAVIFIVFSCTSRSRLAPESVDRGLPGREPGTKSVLVNLKCHRLSFKYYLKQRAVQGSLLCVDHVAKRWGLSERQYSRRSGDSSWGVEAEPAPREAREDSRGHTWVV